MKIISTFIIVMLASLLMIEKSVAQTSLIKMNEIYSRGVAGNLDWIEIYNASATQVNISGYKIYDNGGQGGTKPKKLFPTGTILPAKGFTVIITDTADFSGNLSGFGLSSAGETVWLENSAGAIIDSITFLAMEVTQTYGRVPDGVGSWKLLNTISRGSTNSLVLMNEIYSRGTTTDPDWIEIYNASSVAVNIGGYKIYDNGGQAGTKPKMAFPAGITIAAKGFFVVVTDIPTTTDPSGFGLSSGGETVWLEDNAGAIIDSISFLAMETTQSYGRRPDGGPWALLNTLTRGTSNGPITGVHRDLLLTTDFVLDQNYPNPFNPSTVIRYQVPNNGVVTLKVFDALGREIETLINETQSAGRYSVEFDARHLPSGAYFYRLVAGGFSETKRLVLVK